MGEVNHQLEEYVMYNVLSMQRSLGNLKCKFLLHLSLYHPQSDGLVERFNRTLLNLLSIAVVDAERDWDVHLPLLMFAYCTSVHETNGVTPFFLDDVWEVEGGGAVGAFNIQSTS